MLIENLNVLRANNFIVLSSIVGWCLLLVIESLILLLTCHLPPSEYDNSDNDAYDEHTAHNSQDQSKVWIACWRMIIFILIITWMIWYKSTELIWSPIFFITWMLHLSQNPIFVRLQACAYFSSIIIAIQITQTVGILCSVLWKYIHPSQVILEAFTTEKIFIIEGTSF